MPVISVFWPGWSRQDVHLLPGYVGPRLDHLLWIEHTAGNVRADAAPAGVTVTFAANFPPGAPGAAGVAVSAQGEVTVTGPLPAPPRLLDFLVVATVREGASTFTAYRRFHIHAGIAAMWLTPGALTVHQNARRCRYTLLAEFDDGSYGDITPWCPEGPPAPTDRTYVHLAGSADPAIAWSSSAAGTVGVDAATGLLTGTANAGNATITAARRPLPAPPAATAAATARATTGWATPVTVTLVDGPGFRAMASAKNILLLPDGFTAGQQAAFEKLARNLVAALRTRQRTRPFDLLRDSLNYFMAWVPSPEDGTSPLEQVERVHVVGTHADATEVDTAVAPAAVAGAWHIGAPVANNRFLINERDTSFSAVFGERPSAQRIMERRIGRLQPSRFDEQDFDDFLRALRNPWGTPVGLTWTRGASDQDRIVVLCHSNRTGGANNSRNPSGRYIAMALDQADHYRIEDATAGHGKDLRADPIPPSLGVVLWTRVAHELSHSMTLLDEYGGGGVLPPGQVAALAGVANLQPRSVLLTGGNLDADRVKWRWPRIRRAGVLTTPPYPTGTRYRIRMIAGHAAGFAVGDVVRFRLRPLLTAPPPTDRFIVVSVADPELEVEPLTGAAFNPAGFPAGAALISPVRGPDPNPAAHVYGDDLELIHASIRARINATRNPLNAAAGDPPNRPCAGVLATPTGASNFPPGAVPHPPVYSSWIVGLYENGGGYDCDVYRPTGVCLLRRLEYTDGAHDRAYQFCPVCRYVLVDLIDPSQHGAIDADYAARYPV